MARTTLLLLSILFLLPTNAAIKKLQIEYLTNPIGLDITAPRFSWQLESAERGVRQTAYQITVATDAACLNPVRLPERWHLTNHCTSVMQDRLSPLPPAIIGK